jgi:hypothetical protein
LKIGKKKSGYDANSTVDLSPLLSGETEELLYNTTKQTKTFNLGLAVYRDVFGNEVSGKITLEPFTSKILLGTNFDNITVDNTTVDNTTSDEDLIPNVIGNTEVFDLTSTSANRRAQSVTVGESGEIQSISIYHNGGTGNLLLGVYSDASGSPESLLGVTPSTAINASEGWQAVSLSLAGKCNPGANSLVGMGV